MTHPFEPLLQTGSIGPLELRNRIVLAPMGANLADDAGHCGERLQAFCEARARGGAALVTVGVCAVAHPVGLSERWQLGLSNDAFIPGLAALAQRVHAHGAKLALQLHHAGPAARSDLAHEPWVPSAPLTGAAGEACAMPVRVMSAIDITRVIEQFAAAAARAKAAGVDGVELHAAHTHLLASFLSPTANRRDDGYGGSLENRARLLIETIAAVKARTGSDYPVWVRLDAEERHRAGGHSLNDAVTIARWCEWAGAHAISVSAYTTLATGATTAESPATQAPSGFVANTEVIRRAVGIPVFAAGRIEPAAAAADIAAGRYDFVALGRRLLADADLPRKLADNRPEDVRPCIYCHDCTSRVMLDQRVRCTVNAELGRELEAALSPAVTPLHVLVVGAGPSGLEAARVAALRGHRVTLAERSDRLGGSLFFAALAYPDNGRLLDHLVAQVHALPIEVRLNTEINAASVAVLKPDRVLVATGAQRPPPTLRGATQSHVWNGDELRRLMTGDGADEITRTKLGLAERALFKAGGMLHVTDSTQALQELSRLWMPLGRRVVIVGGGLVGLELAEFLIARGRTVTVLEVGTEAGRDLPLLRRWRVLQAVQHGGTLHTGAAVQSIERDAVLWCDGTGAERRSEADSVVLATGVRPDARLSNELAELGIPVQRIGDCGEVGYIAGAMHSGHRAGCEV
ncbi:FAD-dependent oxidoreductase [Ideonella sp. A 288]|uniref:oxidoreductase n=1 Tax=Ideonella sp. A 288 TaxID=1962181 RepID=UPI000B4C1987|nr:FAD-dependent oxidoreductase [Ideonella sp. A 288]